MIDKSISQIYVGCLSKVSGVFAEDNYWGTEEGKRLLGIVSDFIVRCDRETLERLYEKEDIYYFIVDEIEEFKNSEGSLSDRLSKFKSELGEYKKGADYYEKSEL